METKKPQAQQATKGAVGGEAGEATCTCAAYAAVAETIGNRVDTATMRAKVQCAPYVSLKGEPCNLDRSMAHLM